MWCPGSTRHVSRFSLGTSLSMLYCSIICCLDSKVPKYFLAMQETIMIVIDEMMMTVIDDVDDSNRHLLRFNPQNKPQKYC